MSVINNIDISDPALRDLIMNSFMTSEQAGTTIGSTIGSFLISNNNVGNQPTYSWGAVDPNSVPITDSFSLLTTAINEIVQTIAAPPVAPPVAPVAASIPVEPSFIKLITKLFNSNVNVDAIDLERPIIVRSTAKAVEEVHIFVIGVGGTGSRLVALLTQLMLSRKNVILHLVDPDIVESKNLLRQNFFDFEIDEYKVSALKDRYEALYGIKIEAYDCKISPEFFIPRNAASAIIFDCTDNLDARKNIENLFTINNRVNKKLKEVVLISCGNQKDFGQVHFAYKSIETCESINNNIGNYLKDSHRPFYNSLLCGDIYTIFEDIHFLNMDKKEENISYLPSFLQFNKEFRDSTESISCANFDIAEEQSMAINATIAQTAFNMLFEFLSTNGIKHNIVWANLTNSYSGNQINNIEKYLNYCSQTVFGKNIGFELDKYNQILLASSAKNAQLLQEYSKRSNIYEQAYFSDYYAPVLDISTTSTKYYIAEVDSTKIADYLSIDFITFIDKEILGDLTKQNFGEKYLNYVVFMKFLTNLCSSSDNIKGNISGIRRVTDKLLSIICDKYMAFFLEKQTEYNLSIIKVG